MKVPRSFVTGDKIHTEQENVKLLYILSPVTKYFKLVVTQCAMAVTLHYAHARELQHLPILFYRSHQWTYITRTRASCSCERVTSARTTMRGVYLNESITYTVNGDLLSLSRLKAAKSALIIKVAVNFVTGDKIHTR